MITAAIILGIAGAVAGIVTLGILIGNALSKPYNNPTPTVSSYTQNYYSSTPTYATSYNATYTPSTNTNDVDLYY